MRPGHRDPPATPPGKGMCTMPPQGLVPAMAVLAFNHVSNHDIALKELPSRASARRKCPGKESGVTSRSGVGILFPNFARADFLTNV